MSVYRIKRSVFGIESVVIPAIRAVGHPEDIVLLHDTPDPLPVHHGIGVETCMHKCEAGKMW